MRLNGFFKWNHRDFISVPWHGFAHVKRILRIFVGPSGIVPEDSAVYYISQTLIHVYCDFIRWPDKQVHEPAIVPLDGHFLEVIHQATGESLSSELGGDCHGGNVTVPVFFLVILFVTLDLSQEVALDLGD